ncbi:hypothetical protein LSH36_120g04027 [Paralvinella palmiformis]|uniref:Sulfatase N-terminal domain-containing protein n=1 Tax=Paralvinella palmiformis TaxID=53620 RepID=A0AAD9JZ72_9ANNE|nr:hypothetical protein LSH36_120g04027 [Paralvinella palmiformis]
MRTIYWRRYGIVVPFLIIVLATSVLIATFHHRISRGLGRLRPVKSKPEDDVDSVVKRPNIDDDPDDDDFDDELITDPEDVWTDGDAMALNPDAIPSEERLKSRADDASSVDSDELYSTNTPSGLVVDQGHKRGTTASITTTERMEVADEKGADATTKQSHQHQPPAQHHDHHQLQQQQQPIGLSEYHSEDESAPTQLDFQDVPLSPDEEYSLRLAGGGEDTDDQDDAEDEAEFESENEIDFDNYSPPSGKPLNVLFVIADDLRPQLGAYEGRDYGALHDGHKMYTPNIDRLAKESLVLKRAYAQYSMCGPSRASLMTSRRPDATKVYQNYVYWRYWSVGNFTSIPQYFKENGYTTLGAGKVFHVDHLPKDYDPPSWSLPYFRPTPSSHDRNTSANWIAAPDDEPLVDQSTTQYAVKKMATLAKSAARGIPFFFAVGFSQPHFRHICPAKFFDYYPLEKKKCMFKESWQTPPYAQKMDLAPFIEGVNNTDLTHIPSVAMREIRRAYFACISYVDSLVGELMRGLEENGLANDTMVIFTSDQGYHLGDNDMFGVYSNHDVALHVPLIMKIPGLTDRGVDSRSLVELLDIFPTLIQAAGLPPLPKCPDRSSEIRACTDGVSLLPLIGHPKRYLKDAVFSQLARGRSLTEYAIRTNKYRLIDLALHRRKMLYPGVYQHALDFDLNLQGRRYGRRLYDLVTDPLESENAIHDPRHADTINRLRAKLRHTFKYVHDYSKYLFYSFPE